MNPIIQQSSGVGDALFFFLIVGAVVLVALFIIGWAISRLYIRAEPSVALVKTGLGGSRVIMSGGLIKLPVFHQVTPINMETMSLEERRLGKESLITKDRLRVDVIAIFYTRVSANQESVETAARSLSGRRITTESVKQLVGAKFTDALRAVAMKMTLDELLDKRAEFSKAVMEAVDSDLQKNGLELETVSVTHLDQTAKDEFVQENVNDAQGLTIITERTETERRRQNEIQRESEVLIAEQDYQASLKTLQTERDRNQATLNQQRAIAEATEAQKAEVERQAAEQRRAAREAQIAAEQAIEQADIARRREIELAEADRKIAVAKRSEAESAANAEAANARAGTVKAEEEVVTAREVAMAERSRSIAVIASRQEAEREAVSLEVMALAQKKAAADQAEAVKIEAEAESNAEIIRSKGRVAYYDAEAEGQRKLNEARNSLSEAQVTLQRALETLKVLPAIVEASVKPIEKIGSFKVVHVDGLRNGGGAAGAEATETVGSAGFTDQIVSSALRYRVQAPLIDGLMKDVGLNGGLDALAKGFAMNGAAAAPESERGPEEQA